MSDGHLILYSILEAAQSGQNTLSRAMDTAASTEMIGVLASQLEAFDSIESEAMQLAARRGWEVPLSVRSPLHRYITCIPSLGRRRMTDSKIAEALIYYHTKNIIQELKLSHISKISSGQIHQLLQKLLFCQSYDIRQMQPFL